MALRINSCKTYLLVDTAELTAVASRNKGKALAFAKSYSAKYAFGSYRALFDRDEVDVVYIATPHILYAALAIQAMNSGKHMLCEKPMGMNIQEVEKMITSANGNKVFLMEALWSRFNPLYSKNKGNCSRR